MTVIEVFADVRCPFTHVGLRRLVDERNRVGRDDIVFSVRAWPLELVNSAPLAATLIAEEVDELRTQIAPDLFAGFDVNRFPESSLPAMALAVSGYEHGPATGEAVSLALRDACFEQGKDISATSVLLDLASRTGIEPPTEQSQRRVLDDWHEGRQRGVIGSPHFFVGRDDFFCPSLEIKRVDGHLHISFDQAGFDAFLRRCMTDSPERD